MSSRVTIMNPVIGFTGTYVADGDRVSERHARYVWWLRKPVQPPVRAQDKRLAVIGESASRRGLSAAPWPGGHRCRTLSDGRPAQAFPPPQPFRRDSRL